MADVTGDGIGSPAVYAFTVAPNDNVVFDHCPRALYVGGAGNVAVTLIHGDTVTFVGVSAGTFLPVRAKTVKSTGTTATFILGLY